MAQQRVMSGARHAYRNRNTDDYKKHHTETAPVMITREGWENPSFAATRLAGRTHTSVAGAAVTPRDICFHNAVEGCLPKCAFSGMSRSTSSNSCVNVFITPEGQLVLDNKQTNMRDRRLGSAASMNKRDGG